MIFTKALEAFKDQKLKKVFLYEAISCFIFILLIVLLIGLNKAYTSRALASFSTVDFIKKVFTLNALFLGLIFILAWFISRYLIWLLLLGKKFKKKEFGLAVILGFFFTIFIFLITILIFYFGLIGSITNVVTAFAVTSNILILLIVFAFTFIFGIPVFYLFNLNHIFFKSIIGKTNCSIIIKEKFKKMILVSILCSFIFSILLLLSPLYFRVTFLTIIAYFIYILFFSWYKIFANKVLFENV
ncbi:hypothetical protein ACFL2V_10945 [Pseudomonadota bacterium]